MLCVYVHNRPEERETILHGIDDRGIKSKMRRALETFDPASLSTLTTGGSAATSDTGYAPVATTIAPQGVPATAAARGVSAGATRPARLQVDSGASAGPAHASALQSGALARSTRGAQGSTRSWASGASTPGAFVIIDLVDTCLFLACLC